MDERVMATMTPFFAERFFNPSSPYRQAIEVRTQYHEAKQRLARTIGATADELVMTAGATESINLAITGFDGHKITTEAEHASVKRAIQSSGEYTMLAVDQHARVTPAQVAGAVRDDTTLVSVALANHEIGTLQPIKDIAVELQRIRLARKQAGNTMPLLFHCDASQGFGLIDIHVGRLGVDMLTLNAAKIYGPKQVGLLWVKPGVIVQPRIVGGGQESGLRSGTENVAGVIGFALAAEIAEQKRAGEVKRIGALRTQLERGLKEAFPTAVFSGHPKHRLANFCHVSFPGVDAERLVFMLENDDIMVATGSACAANSGTRSEVLVAIGCSDAEADGSLRLTLGRHTNEAAIQYALDRITAVVRSELQRTGASL